MSEPTTVATKQQKTPKKTGRPSKYTPELAKEICERLSDGEPLRQICRDNHMPAWQKIYEWMVRDEALSGAIARAREQGYDAIAEDLLVIADTPLMGDTETSSANGLTITRQDMLGHRKLQIETRLKLLAKWNPKKYGDRQIFAGDKDNPVKVEADLSIFETMLETFELGRQAKGK